MINPLYKYITSALILLCLGGFTWTQRHKIAQLTTNLAICTDSNSSNAATVVKLTADISADTSLCAARLAAKDKLIHTLTSRRTTTHALTSTATVTIGNINTDPILIELNGMFPANP